MNSLADHANPNSITREDQLCGWRTAGLCSGGKAFIQPTCKLQCLSVGVGSHANEKTLELTKSAFEKNWYLGTKDCIEVLANNSEGERAVLILRDFWKEE